MIDRGLRHAMAALTIVGIVGDAWAHGYVSSPASRGVLCRSGANSGCGPIQYEPQSLEYRSGFPEGGPADGHLGSANLAQFSQLDEQSATRWTKQPMRPGANAFTWTFTANHVTRNFRYYITRPDWNPNERLDRGAFDTTPFCVVDGGMQRPPMQVTHTCQVPDRSGYHLIFAVWEVGDTANSFYNLIDAQFSGGVGTPPDFVARGTIFASVDLRTGDRVRTRVFAASGERTDLQTALTIARDADGLRAQWPFLLASKINAEQRLLRAGERGTDGTITPVIGQNRIFARSDSGVTRVEIQIEQTPLQPTHDLVVSGLPASLTLRNGATMLDVTVTALGELDVTASLIDAAGATRGAASTTLSNTTQTLHLMVSGAKPGPHQLVVRGVPKGEGAPIQRAQPLELVAATGDPTSGGHDFVFPQGLKQYKAGTRVLQPKTGRVYECRPWPNSGYCQQWSPSATQFEPGVGSHWAAAWIAR